MEVHANLVHHIVVLVHQAIGATLAILGHINQAELAIIAIHIAVIAQEKQLVVLAIVAII